jgi:tetratricopeptide (TPR) repeat protein
MNIRRFIQSASFASILVINVSAQTTARPVPSPAARARALFAEGSKLIDGGQYDAASDKISAGLKLDPKSAVGHFYLAEIDQKLGHNSDAEAEYKLSLRLDPNSKVADQAATGLSEIHSAGQASPQTAQSTGRANASPDAESLNFITQSLDGKNWSWPTVEQEPHLIVDSWGVNRISATGCTLHITATRDELRSSREDGFLHPFLHTHEIWNIALPLDRVDLAHVAQSGPSVVIPTTGKYIPMEHVYHAEMVRDPGTPHVADTSEHIDADTEHLNVPSEDLARRLVLAFKDAATSCGAKASKY